MAPRATAASTWTVNTTNDAAPSASECSGTPGDCSLRQATDKASAGDTIVVPAGAYDLSPSLPEISLQRSVTISGAGASTTTIKSSGETGIFNDDGLSSSDNVTISGVTLSGGAATASGGALDLASGATFDLRDDVLSRNVATNGAGGAIELTNLTTMTVSDSTIGPGDTATTNGGAVDNDGGTLTVDNSTVSGNSASDGGGISSEGTTGAEHVGVSTLQYVTVAFNTASTSGGDLFSSDAGGDDPAPVDISDSVVADGGAPIGNDCNANADGFFGTYNVTDSIASTGTASCGFTQMTDTLGDARLGSLQDNGGQTDTEALAAGSPAIDLIPALNASCTGTDQRGTARPQGSGCDAGALEAGGGETAPQWSVAHDFSLTTGAVWSYELAPVADLHVPADYEPLPSTTTTGGNCGNLDAWTDDGALPVVDFDATTATIACGTVTVPAQTVVMHPSGTDYSIVGWTSPVSGTVSVAGSFVSMDDNGGSGTTWYVDDGSNNLASGVNDLGGSGNFDMQSLSVSKGDVLYFILGPAVNGDDSFDTTELNLTISQAAPPPSADVTLAAQAQPNPVTVGQTLDDTFTVTNNGPDQADGVSLSDTLPNGVTFQSVATTKGTCSGTTTITCNLGPLINGEQESVSVEFQPTQAGSTNNSASVSSTTSDPNLANNSATASASVNLGAGNGGCATAMAIDTVQVLADCIASQGDGTYRATGHTRFANGANIVDAGTQTPATLVLNPSAHTISIAPGNGGGGQSGELEAGGRDVATGDLVIETQGVQDPVSGRGAVAMVGGIGSVDLSLSGWTFGDIGVSPTVYLAPSSAGGGAIVDGRLTLPAWLGAALAFGTLTPGVDGVSGQLAMQVSSSGAASVLNGGVSFHSSLLGIPQLTLAQGQITYQGAGDVWSGTTLLGFSGLQLGVDVTIGQGKLDDLSVNFACGTSGDCSGQNVQGGAGAPGVPKIGAVLDLKDAALQVVNLQGVSYTPFQLGVAQVVRCIPKFNPCAAPPPAPQIDGQIIVDALGDKVVAGGGFSYLLDGAFSASGTVGLAPLFGHTFPYPAALAKNQQAVNVVNTLLKSANTGVELAGASLDYTPPSLLQATGTLYLPPPPFPLQFLRGTISLGIDPPHFTGEGSLDLVIPGYVPIIGGDTAGGVEGLISDKAAAAQVSIPQFCAPFIGCSPGSILVAFNFQTGKFTWDIGGGNINDFATVPQASASAVGGTNRRTVSVPGGKQLASIVVRGARGTPNVALIGPRGSRRRLTLATSRRRAHNRSGALAWVDRATHAESFLVLLPRGGRWTVKRLTGPRIVSVTVMVPRHKLRTSPFPHAVERSADLPTGRVPTTGSLKLHYRVPSAGPHTTVDLWAGTGPHGAGGVMVADGLSPSGAATWKLSGVPSGRYWPYAIVNQNGVPVSIQYWPRSVEVFDPAAPAAPTSLQAVLNAGLGLR